MSIISWSNMISSRIVIHLPCAPTARLYPHCLPLPHNARADSRFAPSQWETALLRNDVSHWLGENLESAQNAHTCFGPSWVTLNFQRAKKKECPTNTTIIEVYILYNLFWIHKFVSSRFVMRCWKWRNRTMTWFPIFRITPLTSSVRSNANSHWLP